MNTTYLVGQGWRASRKLPLIELASRSTRFYPLVAFDPTVATLVVTENCNGRCLTCNYWRNQSTDELTLGEIDGVLAELKELGVRGISITGGEPLLREDLPEIVRACSRLGFREVQLLTNGLLLEQDLAEELVGSGVTTIGISVDGLRATNDLLRGMEGSFDRAVAALEMISRLRDEKWHRTEVYMATTLMEPTVDEIIPLANLARELKVKINVNLLDGSPHFFHTDIGDLLVKDQNRLDRVVDELHRLRSEERSRFLVSQTHTCIEYIRGYFRDPRRADIPCVLGHFCVYVGAHGEVYSGCFALDPVGSIRERSLSEIVTSPDYSARLRDMFYKRCPGCASHHGLNLLYHASWIRDEIGWELRMRAASARRRLASISPIGAERPA
jgi:MoaA/NifB/PqqE/SkfB family radical SAM enzyme